MQGFRLWTGVSIIRSLYTEAVGPSLALSRPAADNKNSPEELDFLLL